MFAVASAKPHKYPVTSEWKTGVRAELKKRGRGSHAWLAREVGCSTGELSELLGPDSKYSDLVAPIHKALGWRVPRPPLPGSPDVLEIDYLIDRLKLGAEERQLIAGAVDSLRKDGDAEKRQAALAVLRLLTTPKNDAH